MSNADGDCFATAMSLAESEAAATNTVQYVVAASEEGLTYIHVIEAPAVLQSPAVDRNSIIAIVMPTPPTTPILASLEGESLPQYWIVGIEDAGLDDTAAILAKWWNREISDDLAVRWLTAIGVQGTFHRDATLDYQFLGFDEPRHRFIEFRAWPPDTEGLSFHPPNMFMGQADTSPTDPRQDLRP
jgi:hypothetical protein